MTRWPIACRKSSLWNPGHPAADVIRRIVVGSAVAVGRDWPISRSHGHGGSCRGGVFCGIFGFRPSMAGVEQWPVPLAPRSTHRLVRARRGELNKVGSALSDDLDTAPACLAVALSSFLLSAAEADFVRPSSTPDRTFPARLSRKIFVANAKSIRDLQAFEAHQAHGPDRAVVRVWPASRAFAMRSVTGSKSGRRMNFVSGPRIIEFVGAAFLLCDRRPFSRRWASGAGIGDEANQLVAVSARSFFESASQLPLKTRRRLGVVDRRRWSDRGLLLATAGAPLGA